MKKPTTGPAIFSSFESPEALRNACEGHYGKVFVTETESTKFWEFIRTHLNKDRVWWGLFRTPQGSQGWYTFSSLMSGLDDTGRADL